MGYIRGICISKERGTAKHEVESAKFIPDWGIEGDAHAGHWHRQVSLLSLEKINEFRAKGADVAFGAFGENLIVEGFDLRNLPIGTQLRSGDVLLEITQIGKNVTVTVRYTNRWENALCHTKAYLQSSSKVVS